LLADCQTLFIEPALCQLVLYRFALFQSNLAKFELIRIKNFQGVLGMVINPPRVEINAKKIRKYVR